MPAAPAQAMPAEDMQATQVFQLSEVPAAAPAQPATLPPTIPPLDQFADEEEPEEHEPRHQGGGKKNTGKTVGIVIAVVVVVALIAGGLFWWHSNSSKVSQAAALVECKAAAKQYDSAKKKLTTAITNGQTSAQTPTSDVADVNTITTLNQAVQDAGTPVDTATCDSKLSADELKKQTEDMQSKGQRRRR